VLHVIGVGGRDGFPGVPGRVSCRNTEGGQQPLFPVGAMVSQRLARPFTGDQDPASAVTEVIRVVGFALAPAGDQAGPGALGLDAVAEPVRAPRAVVLGLSVSQSRPPRQGRLRRRTRPLRGP
jgi:hypothetical protein